MTDAAPVPETGTADDATKMSEEDVTMKTENEDDPAKDGGGDEDDDPAKDDDDDDDDDSTSSTDSSDAPAPKEDPELLLIKAANHKEQGNNFFKEKDFDKAARSYRRGVNALKPLNKANTGDDQVKALLVSLQTNLSMMCFKMSKYKQSMTVAGNVLKIDAKNVKARYRRAVAHRKLGNTDEAREDLKEALKLDPSNTAVKKELLSVKKELETIKAAQKKGLQKAFGTGSFLYDDKEAEKKRKEEEKKLQKKREEEALKKRKVEWEDECVKRMAKGEQAISFEDWEKERKEKEEAAKKKQEEEEKRRKEAQRKARQATKKDDSDSEDEKLTEAELAQFRGYKKTADGRVTSYFTKELSAEEKSLIGNIAPKRLETNSAGNGSAENAATIAAAAVAASPSSGNATGSAWNQAGTWEEKDTTEWCRKQLKKRLKQTKAEGSSSKSIIAKVCKVNDMTGDASVAIVSSKKRYIFDFHCKLDFEIQDADTDDVLASGSLNLPDICSTHHEELEVTIGAWTKVPPSEKQQHAEECRYALCSEVRESVKLWVKDFNDSY